MVAKKKTKAGSRRRTKKTRRKKKAIKGTPGRRLTSEEQQKRLAALKKHATKGCPEPLTAQQIADKLGINVGTWNVWKMNQKRRSGVRSAGRRGRPRKAASAASLDSVIHSFREIERERDQLQKVLHKVQNALAELR